MESRAPCRPPIDLAAEELDPNDRHGQARYDDDYAKDSQRSGGSRCRGCKEERHAEDKADAGRNVQPGGGFKEDSDDADKRLRVDNAHRTKSGSQYARCKGDENHALLPPCCPTD